MYDSDEPNDSAVLSAVRDSMSGVPLPAAPPLDVITARGRARRRRHVGGLSLASAGACAALAVGLAASPGSAGPAPQAGPAPRHGATPVHLAAFSVVTGPDGDTTLTLYPGEVADPNAVRQALAEHGIPALVTAGKFCYTASQPGPGINQVVVLPHPRHLAAGHSPGPIVIHGSAIPTGAELSIGYRQDPQDHQISFKLIRAGASLTCSSIPDDGPHGNG